jgi:plastocyanin
MKLTVLVVALLAVAVIAHADSGKTAAANANVNVGDFWFCNSSYSGGTCPTVINPGDTVTWTWVGSFQHTTTACSDGTFTTCGAAQGWDSPVMTSGTFQRTFNTAGTFFYRCNLHPGTMLGRIDVIQDTDGDGWSDTAEAVIGTNPNAACGANAWPADINNSGFADTADIALLTNGFGDAVPTVAPHRHDLAPDPPLAPPNAFIDTADIARLTGLFGRGCPP